MKNNINNLTKSVTLNEARVIYVLNKKVCCEGSLEYSTHPRVFLQIPDIDNKESKIICPYCKQIFIYKEQSDAK